MSDNDNPLKINPAGDPLKLRAKRTRRAEEVHKLPKGICHTDTVGHANPDNKSPWKIVVDATDGFIPLWAKDNLLRWRFQERSMDVFENPTAAKSAIERLFGESVLEWGDSAPIKFVNQRTSWDFEIVVKAQDDCDDTGCVLAAAFFPDGGRHELEIYPKMFSLSRDEQIATLAHEIGHIYGLRHFFANITETEWKSEIFGEHNPFTIMNYGDKSVLTAQDRKDLKKLYKLAWGGELTRINGTPIRLVKPYHTLGPQ